MSVSLMGSVKDLTIKKKPTAAAAGLGVFKFSDDYSVFDYGKMPDTIPGKGEALCRMAAYNFRELAKLGVKSHFRSLPKPNEMEVDLVRVLYPQRNEIKEGDTNYLVPLEVIFRNSLPAGSSVFKRLQRGELKLADLGLGKVPEPNEHLPKPIVDVSTKLEQGDRYLSWEEAREMAKLSAGELAELKRKTLQINDYLNKKAHAVGLEHADGKVEFALNPKRELILVDVCGTPDENRFLFKGVNLSKQVLRDYYAREHAGWVTELEKAKKEKKPKADYPVPPHLPAELVKIASVIYKSVASAWIGEKINGAKRIEDAVADYPAFEG
ncbi:MAG: phosphoribosylaminoimidazolesuccinocarboxamide synthase [Candidatus Diapherotrites archaeon]